LKRSAQRPTPKAGAECAIAPSTWRSRCQRKEKRRRRRPAPVWCLWKTNRKRERPGGLSLERRWSSRRFPYGYLVTTSPQSLTLPWPAASLAG
jgi:hypothetical protein